MSTTNHTVNYELSQYIGTDVTSYLSNYNSDMHKIDTQMKVNATDAATAKSDASAAVNAATSAASSASAAVSTANAANSTAEAAQTAATAAQTAAGAAQTIAEKALEASASNTIGNLAPSYDPTLTYAVGNLVTYVDPETNQGKLYKCIVPIVTPEAFNINKWDDVTTSEVYQPKPITFTFEGNDYATLAELLTAVRTALMSIPNIASRKVDLYENYDQAYPTLYHLVTIDNALLAPTFYFSAALANPVAAQIRSYSLGTTIGGLIWKMDTNGNNKTDTDITASPNNFILSVL